MLNPGEIKKIQNGFKDEDDGLSIILCALGDTNRFRIFKLLMNYHDLCVTDVASILQITVPAASQHFRILEMTGIIRKEKMGQMVCYMLRKDDPVIKLVISLFNKNYQKWNAPPARITYTKGRKITTIK